MMTTIPLMRFNKANSAKLVKPVEIIRHVSPKLVEKCAGCREESQDLTMNGLCSDCDDARGDMYKSDKAEHRTY